MGGIPFAFCTLLGCFFLLLGIFVHKIGAVGNSIALIVLLQLQDTADGNADRARVCRAFTDGNKNCDLGVARILTSLI